MTTNSPSARPLHVILLAFALSCIAAGVVWFLGDRFIDEMAAEAPGGLLRWATIYFVGVVEEPVIAHYLMFFGGILLAQWLFLRPRGDWKVQLAEKARPMKSAIAIAAFMAMLISVGALAVLLEVLELNLWDALEKTTEWIGSNDSESNSELWLWYAIILATWLMWALIFYVYWQEGERFGQFGKMIGGLIAGSTLELFVAIGVYAWNPQKEDCWCARGSFLGVVFGATVVVWAFGPGLLLLFLRRQRERGERLARRGGS